MSDIFDFSSVADGGGVDFGDLPAVANASTFSLPDLSSLLGSVTGSVGSTAPLVAPVQNLPLPTGGLSNVLGDITKLVTGVYNGEAQITAAQNAADLAAARQQNALATVRTTPNIWLVLGLGAAGIFALELMDRSK